ncbi:MAG: hypothetical protein KJ052_06835 [Candidatus Hydrogenedentes bacterium]|nr:hypothetical protein [Candidatus Hydrogenedentota bacterium]
MTTKDVTIRARFTADEADEIQRKATAANQSVSDFVRDALLKAEIPLELSGRVRALANQLGESEGYVIASIVADYFARMDGHKLATGLSNSDFLFCLANVEGETRHDAYLRLLDRYRQEETAKLQAELAKERRDRGAKK